MPQFDVDDLDQQSAYFLLTSLVVPRPIAWVSSLSVDGLRNLAPHSFFNIVSLAPPIIQFVSTGEKDTLRNVRDTGEFVVNVVTDDLLGPMNLTATDFPASEDEFSWAGLEAAPSEQVAAPRVANARSALECRVHAILTIGTGNMVIAEVVHIHVADSVWHDGRVSPSRLRAVGRLSGAGYTVVDDVIRIPRQTWDDQAQQPGPTGR